MHVDSVDTNNLFLATNSNNITHATCIGNKASPKVYRGNDTGQCEDWIYIKNRVYNNEQFLFTEYSGGTRCIEACPFRRSFFLVKFMYNPKRTKNVNNLVNLGGLRRRNCEASLAEG